MCGANALDLITPSLPGMRARPRQSRLWDLSNLADAATSKIFTFDEVGQCSWTIGTGYSDPLIINQTSYYAAYNRTYVVVTVFGHGADVSNAAEPVAAKLACLRPTWSALPTPTTTRSKAASTSVASKTTAAVSAVTTSPQSTSSSSAVAAPASVFRWHRYVSFFLSLSLSHIILFALLSCPSFACSHGYCPDGACQVC
ncbi:hypothetical protein CDEST_15417 [Colletotrichum destructivum]|uniref:Uncharacterized protein n=1 Tax=Colletotrichum destructivum TaxID=34406 RepID=A0AAX4J494_9PEZI|nr:hypothetical protein CDEST_15417 [Colletotrichum destructivum]